MKICYIGYGESIHLQKWIDFFAARGHEISVIADTKSTLQSCIVHRIDDYMMPVRIKIISAIYQIFMKRKAIRQLLKEIQPDIVHGHYATNYGYLAALSGFHPLVQTVHGSDIMLDRDSKKENRYFIKYALQNADLVTSVARHLSDKIVNAGIHKNKIITFQYGIDENIFFLPEKRKNDPLIVSTRNLEQRYNVQLLINAIPDVIEKIPEAKFIIIGDGPDRSALIELSQKIGIERNIEFTGQIGQKEIAENLRDATIYVSTSLTDGASLSLFEAMACGAFPIVTDIEANREWITHGSNGLLVPTDNPHELAKTIIQIMQNDQSQKVAEKLNSVLIQERCSYQRNMEKMEDQYKVLLNRKKIK